MSAGQKKSAENETGKRSTFLVRNSTEDVSNTFTAVLSLGTSNSLYSLSYAWLSVPVAEHIAELQEDIVNIETTEEWETFNMHKAAQLYAHIMTFYRRDCKILYTDKVKIRKNGVRPHPIWIADRYAERWFATSELAYNKHDRDLATPGPISYVDLKELL